MSLFLSFSLLWFFFSNLLVDWVKMKTTVVLLLVVVVLGAVNAAEKCNKPAPASGFTYEGYEGFWYEIGKIQTKGGAYFERECVCTTINIRFFFLLFP